MCLEKHIHSNGILLGFGNILQWREYVAFSVGVRCHAWSPIIYTLVSSCAMVQSSPHAIEITDTMPSFCLSIITAKGKKTTYYATNSSSKSTQQ